MCFCYAGLCCFKQQSVVSDLGKNIPGNQIFKAAWEDNLMFVQHCMDLYVRVDGCMH